VLRGEIVERLVWRKAETGEQLVRVGTIRFSPARSKSGLRNCGVIDR